MISMKMRSMPRAKETDYTLSYLLRDRSVLLKTDGNGISAGKVIGPGGTHTARGDKCVLGDTRG